MTNFDEAFTYLIANEGQIAVNDPADRGGLTKFGITQKSWADFLLVAPGEDVAQSWSGWPTTVDAITLAMAKSFYQRMYWPTPSQAPTSRIATVWFDASVLMGAKTANKLLQSSINVCVPNALVVDGIAGPKTLEALGNLPLTSAFLLAFVAACQQFFLSIVAKDATRRKFLRTWLRRASAYLELAV